jgi:mannose-6-phosphate isomerase-like protein (cupin superfamily)
MRIIIGRAGIFAAFALLAIMPAAAQAAPQILYAWAPKPSISAPYTAPNRPIWRLSEIVAAHKNQPSWSQEVLRDPDYTVRYIQMAPGEKTRTQFWADDRIYWIVWSGEIRFVIQGQAPFVARKGYLVQVPYRVPYSMETVGDAPALRVEVTRTGRTPVYPLAEGENRPAAPNRKYVKTSYNVAPDTYSGINKPYIDFEKEYVDNPKSPSGSIMVMEDTMNSSFVIRGHGVPTPPSSNKGHFHVDYGESWFIMEGQIDYLIEGEKLLTAYPGDFVYVPHGHWHRASFGGAGMDTRLSITPRPHGMHCYAPEAGAKQ